VITVGAARATARVRCNLVALLTTRTNARANCVLFERDENSVTAKVEVEVVASHLVTSATRWVGSE
jgi:hypothetical protein